MSGEAQCRAWLVRGGVSHLREAGRAELVTLASDPLRALLRQTQDGWAPLALLVEALELAERIEGDRSGALAWRIGHHLARGESGPVRSLALRILRPPIIMSLASGLWGTHFQHAGRVVARGRADRDMAVSFIDVPVEERWLCMAIGGWMEGFLGMGARHGIVVQQVACRCDGASACEYSVTWEE